MESQKDFEVLRDQAIRFLQNRLDEADNLLQHPYDVGDIFKTEEFEELLSQLDDQKTILAENHDGLLDSLKKVKPRKDEVVEMDTYLQRREDLIKEATAVVQEAKGRESRLRIRLSKQLKLDAKAREELDFQRELQQPQVQPAADVRVTAKLPLLQLEDFDGNPNSFVKWWNCFESSIHLNPKLRSADKMSYLKKYMKKGSFEDDITTREHTDAGYNAAIAALREEFLKPEDTIVNLRKQLKEVSAPTKDPQSLRAFYGKIMRIFQELERHGQPPYFFFFSDFIFSKLPYGAA